jgi:methyl-accepting chemotaxis protein
MTKFSDLKIGTKLIAGFSLLALLVVLIGGVGYNGIEKVARTGNLILEEQVPIADFSMELAIDLITTRDLLGEYLSREEGLDDIEAEFFDAFNVLRNLYAEKDQLNLTDEERNLVESFGAKLGKYEAAAREMMNAHKEAVYQDKESGELMEKMDAQVGPLMEEAKKVNFTLDEFEIINEAVMVVNDYIITESKEELKAFKELDFQIRNLQKFSSIASQYAIVNDFAKQTMDAVNKHIENRALSYKKMERADKISSEMEKIGERLEEKVDANMNKAMVSANATQSFSINLQVVLTLISVSLALIMGFSISRSISNPLRRVVDVVNKIAKGDLTEEVTVRSKDEIGQLASAMRMMENDLSNIVGNIRLSSETVASGANQIASGNQDLSQRSQEQASALEETASTVEQITANIRANAENAQKANDIAQKAASAAQRGGDVVKKTVDSMQEVTNSSKKIGDIINVVNEIAFQTNLLALNAAVEAARAGEQGRGFAVVAGEVRNLAGRSAEAAKEIQSLIKDSVEKVQAGNQLVEETGTTLSEIIEGVNNVAITVSEISAASQEQASGIEQVNKAVAQMDEVVQQNASLVEEAAATSENLTGQADEMQRLMGTFKINGYDNVGNTVTHHVTQKVTHWDKSAQPVKAEKEAVAETGTKPIVKNAKTGTEAAVKKDDNSDSHDHFSEF